MKRYWVLVKPHIGTEVYRLVDAFSIDDAKRAARRVEKDVVMNFVIDEGWGWAPPQEASA
jgi:hypothetical protein